MPRKKRAPLPPVRVRPAPPGGYEPEVKEKALVAIMANVWTKKMTFVQLSEHLGIPAATLQRWSQEARSLGPDGQPTPELQRMYREAHDLAVQEAAGYIQERLEHLADRYYAVAEMALEKVERALKDIDELSEEERRKGLYLTRDVNGASWARMLIQGATGLAKTAQLLAGKPTTRTEHHERKEEYKVTIEAALGDPETREVLRRLYRRTRGVGGGERVHVIERFDRDGFDDGEEIEDDAEDRGFDG